MKNFIEFNWEKKYLYMIALAFLMSFRMEINFSNKNKSKENLSASIIFDLITECCLSFSIFIFIIEKCKIKNKNNLNIQLHLIRNPLKNVKKYDIYILPKSSAFHIFLIFILIALTALFKFYFSVVNYYICLKKFHNYNEFLNTFFSTFLIVNTCILSLIKIKISKKKFYLHNIISIINILLITIVIVIIYYKINYTHIKTSTKEIFFSSFFCWSAIFLFFINLIIYKILSEKYFVSIYALNTIEGIYITIYTLFFYYLFIKKEKENAFDFNIFYLIISSTMQIIINLLVKFIVYSYDEIHTTIPFFLQIFIDSVKNIIKGIYKNNNDSQLKLNLWLIIPNLYLIFFLLVFIEIIIIKVCNMEKKTNKYLHIFEIEEYEIPDKIVSRNSIEN